MNDPIKNRSEVSKFIINWKDRNEGRSFDFDDFRDQELFLDSLLELGRHIAHTARQAQLFTITDKDGLSTLYLKVDN